MRPLGMEKKSHLHGDLEASDNDTPLVSGE